MLHTVSVVLQAVVLLGAIFLGVRMGGIGLGLRGRPAPPSWSSYFQLDPGSPPVEVFSSSSP